MSESAPPYHAQDPDDVIEAFEVDVERGLTEDQVQQRREQHGLNQLHHSKRRSAWRILLEQFKSVVILILFVAGVAAVVTAQWPEAIAIFAVVVINTLIGFFSEWKAVRSMEQLRGMAGQSIRVRRDGEEQDEDVESLVPGDIVLIEAGSLVPADLRLIESQKLRVNEAALTGESVPADKRVEAVEAEAPLAERSSMLYKGTSVSDGSAVAITVATGTTTELGRIAELAEQAESTTAPLQKRLDRLGRRLAWITVGIALAVALTGLAAGRDTLLMIETAIALGVAAIPEGLPIVATIALARGMWLMAQRNALVNRLTAVETLGATRVIFTDKTGTLTENQMSLQTVATSAADHRLDQQGQETQQADRKESAQQTAKEQDADKKHASSNESESTESASSQALLRRALAIGVLCNGASLAEDDEDPSGDPTEIGLLKAGKAFDLAREKLLQDQPEQRVEDFDPDVMMMATYHQRDDGIYVAVKGAPRAVFEVCDSVVGSDGQSQSLDDQRRQEWEDRVERLAADGLRMLAVADKVVDDVQVEPYEGLQLVGLVGLLDPPREEVRSAIHRCQAAGIRVVMVTGDQPTTGRAIGRAVGIGDKEEAEVMRGSELKAASDMSAQERERVLKTVVFARVSPEQKLNLVDFYQQRGEPVAMTGDGVNDAPALKKADIGIAMGKRGTDAARQVAHMILQDDSFETIVAAVEQGRIIFGNIRKSVVFMLCTNVAEILAVTVASLIGAPLPLRPLQILYLNVLTDVFPALALGVGKGRPQVMEYPPRDPNESVLTKHHWKAIVAWSVVIASVVLTALVTALLWLGVVEGHAITISFLTLGFGKLWFVFNLRDHDSKWYDNDVVRNGWVWAAIGFCIVLLLAAVYLPGLNTFLETQRLRWQGWALVLALSLAPTILGLFVPGIRFHGRSGDDSDAKDRDQVLVQRLDKIQQQVEDNQQQIDSLSESMPSEER